MFDSQSNREYYDYCGRKVICPRPVPGPCPVKGGDLSGIQLQMVNLEALIIDDNGKVPFNLVINQPSPDISYDSINNEILLPANKNYYISWWVSVNGSETVPFIEFAIIIDEVESVIAASPLVTGQICGTALVSGGNGAKTISLQNVSKDRVRFAETTVQADLVVIELIRSYEPGTEK